MAVTVYKSTDASAPVLDGQVGSLVNLLDKCLVAGYGSKTAAGWTKPYTSGSHSAVFTQGAGSGFSLDVNDNGPGAGTYKEARVRGYETMSAVATGTGPFPTVAQFANGMFWRKSASLDATTRRWAMYADARTFYLFVEPGDNANTWNGMMFGDMKSYVSSDAYNCMVIGRGTENSVSQSNPVETFDTQNLAAQYAAAVTGHYIARGYAQTGGSLAVNKMGDVYFRSAAGAMFSASAYPMAGNVTYPVPASGSLMASRVTITETGTRRGYMRGLWQCAHAGTNFAEFDVIEGSGDLAARTFEVVKGFGGASVFLLETSDTWET